MTAIGRKNSMKGQERDQYKIDGPLSIQKIKKKERKHYKKAYQKTLLKGKALKITVMSIHILFQSRMCKIKVCDQV